MLSRLGPPARHCVIGPLAYTRATPASFHRLRGPRYASSGSRPKKEVLAFDELPSSATPPQDDLTIGPVESFLESSKPKRKRKAKTGEPTLESHPLTGQNRLSREMTMDALNTLPSRLKNKPSMRPL